MARKLRLPDPKEYARKVAEDRYRDSGTPEVLRELERLAQSLDRAIEAVADKVLRRIAEGEAPREPDERVLETLANLQERVDGLAEELSALPGKEPPVPQVDLSGLMGRLDGIEEMVRLTAVRKPSPAPKETQIPMMPSEFNLRVLSRDNSNDIDEVKITVTKH